MNLMFQFAGGLALGGIILGILFECLTQFIDSRGSTKTMVLLSIALAIALGFDIYCFYQRDHLLVNSNNLPAHAQHVPAPPGMECIQIPTGETLCRDLSQ